MVPSLVAPSPGRSLRLALGLLLLEIGPERLDVVLLHDDALELEVSVRRQDRVVPLQEPRQDPHRLAAVPERLLADRPVDRAVLDAIERRVLLVEADDLDLPGLPR